MASTKRLLCGSGCLGLGREYIRQLDHARVCELSESLEVPNDVPMDILGKSSTLIELMDARSDAATSGVD